MVTTVQHESRTITQQEYFCIGNSFRRPEFFDYGMARNGTHFLPSSCNPLGCWSLNGALRDIFLKLCSAHRKILASPLGLMSCLGV